MRFIRDENNRLLYVSFGADIACDGQTCTEYVGDVPDGYQSLESWYIIEQEKLYRWTVVDVPVTDGGTITTEYALVLDEDAVAPPDRSRVLLNDFNPWREYMENDKEGYHHTEPYYSSDGETGFLVYNGDNVYILQMSQTGLLLRWYKDGTFVDYRLDGDTATDGVGIANIQQTTTSDEDDGDNVITITLTDGKQYTFTVQNGSKGSSDLTTALTNTEIENLINSVS